ncbi:hypothetical protein D3C84_1157010 [compost metagenome]
MLDGNLLTVNPLNIVDIKVLETIKEGKTVYRRDTAQKADAITGCVESDACFMVASRALGLAGFIHTHTH